MTNRTTQADIRKSFALAFAGTAAYDIGADGTNVHNIDRYALDYAACYGGWVVIRYSGGDSGAGYCHGPTPWGDRRRTGREMLAWLEGLQLGRKMEIGLI